MLLALFCNTDAFHHVLKQMAFVCCLYFLTPKTILNVLSWHTSAVSRHCKSTYWFLPSDYLHFEISDQANKISSMCTLQTRDLEFIISHQSSSMYLRNSAHDALALPRSFNTSIRPTCPELTQISICTSLKSHSHPDQSQALTTPQMYLVYLCHRAGDLLLLHDCFCCSCYSSYKLNISPYLAFSLQIFWYQYFLSQDPELCKTNSHLCVSSY